MIAQGLVDEPVFSFRLGLNEEGGGEAIFGGIDTNAYIDNITYVPVRRKAYWEVELEQFTLGNDTLELSNTGAAIDTGEISPSNFGRARTQHNGLSKALPLSLFRPQSLR